jgi:hypothetical protein
MTREQGLIVFLLNWKYWTLFYERRIANWVTERSRWYPATVYLKPMKGVHCQKGYAFEADNLEILKRLFCLVRVNWGSALAVYFGMVINFLL